MTLEPFEIAGRAIGPGHAPYVIAELSGNHNGDIERAFAILAAAKEVGADAVKLQTYTADTMTIDYDGPGFTVDLPLWKGRKLYDLYDEAHTPWAWHEPLFARGRELDITVFSSPFDASAVDFLEGLGAPAYKIASFEIVDVPLIEKAASTGKPLIISTGMASEEEIGDAVEAARGAGCRDLVLLHCVSAYPAPAEEMNIGNIAELRARFGVHAGLSDHSMGTAVPVAATALGACVIEKHVTLSRADGGVDSAFSLEPAELAQLVADVRTAALAAGTSEFGGNAADAGGRVYRRSLYAVADIARGERLTAENVRAIRPGYGLKPKYYASILGRAAKRDIARGTPLSLDMIDDG